MNAPRDDMERGGRWLTPPRSPRLSADEVHVWRASLMRREEEMMTLLRSLSEDELRRADRFRFPRDQARFIAARGVLREILGRYLRTSPERVRFGYNAYGKPELLDAEERERLRFNLSHAGSVALFAFASGREVGVDVETLRDDAACAEVAAEFFSRREVETLRALPAHARTRAFYNCWTRKEAYIKARGMGLSLPLDCFDVSLAPGEPAALLATRGTEPEAARWSLREIDVETTYVAAVAVEGGVRLRCWLWP
ncbi:MAG: 4-phosphopantetheinyl transferase [Acidobacteriota bacterium]|jgi:4'-phosphopantetheinyl transferase|nr:4-phosphopantetheinyl transferase [Acidobacteriota bacterium]